MKINLPNKLTIARIILCPFFMIFIVYPIPSEVWSRIIAAALFLLATITDALDGQIARSKKLVTDFGKFLQKCDFLGDNNSHIERTRRNVPPSACF